MSFIHLLANDFIFGHSSPLSKEQRVGMTSKQSMAFSIPHIRLPVSHSVCWKMMESGMCVCRKLVKCRQVVSCVCSLQLSSSTVSLQSLLFYGTITRSRYVMTCVQGLSAITIFLNPQMIRFLTMVFTSSIGFFSSLQRISPISLPCLSLRVIGTNIMAMTIICSKSSWSWTLMTYCFECSMTEISSITNSKLHMMLSCILSITRKERPSSFTVQVVAKPLSATLSHQPFVPMNMSLLLSLHPLS